MEEGEKLIVFNIFPISYVKYMYDSNEMKAPSTACVALLFRLAYL